MKYLLKPRGDLVALEEIFFNCILDIFAFVPCICKCRTGDIGYLTEQQRRGVHLASCSRLVDRV